MNKKSVLYIGDSKNIFMLVNYHLSRKGYNVFYWNDDAMIFDFSKIDFIPNVIVLETKVENQLFFTICNKIRVQPGLCSVPILILSELNHLEKSNEYQMSGADGFLMMPFNLEDLFKSIKTIEK